VLRLNLHVINQMVKEKFRTQSKFAEHLGWSQPRLSKLLTAQWENTRISTLGELCIGLGLEIEQIHQIIVEDGQPARKEFGPEDDGVPAATE
jgi:DNA-binding Xre family transcriptional regulator